MSNRALRKLQGKKDDLPVLVSDKEESEDSDEHTDSLPAKSKRSKNNRKQKINLFALVNNVLAI